MNAKFENFQKRKKHCAYFQRFNNEAFFENLERSREEDDMCLLKGAKIIRQDLLAYSMKILITVPKDICFQKFVLHRMILEGKIVNTKLSYATN